MMREGLLKENIDGEALLWAHNRLIARPEERRILMVISDGAPVDDSTASANGGTYLEKHLRQVIGWIEARSPVELAAIGIGHDVTRYYARAVTIMDAEQLGGALVAQLAALLDSTCSPLEAVPTDSVRNGGSRQRTLRDAREMTRSGMTGGEIPSAQGLNNDLRLNQPERPGQRRFRNVAASALIFLAILPLAGSSRYEGPNRSPAPAALADLKYELVSLRGTEAGPLRIAGAWRVEVNEPRFAGVSALAVGPAGLLALTDSGVLVDLPKPGSRAVARLRDLPTGPGTPFFKRNRDSESLARDVDRNGWWVGFENRHSLWFYDRAVRRGRQVASLSEQKWRVNKGVEGLVLSRRQPLLLPEPGSDVLFRTADGWTNAPFAGGKGEIADAIRVPDGRVLVTVRSVGLTGIRNRLGWLVRTTRGYRLDAIATLPLGPFDNVEGLAAEQLPDGRTRIWAITDNDGWRRTLLIALDLPNQPKAARGKAGTASANTIKRGAEAQAAG
jgi:hypothetical protein